MVQVGACNSAAVCVRGLRHNYLHIGWILYFPPTYPIPIARAYGVKFEIDRPTQCREDASLHGQTVTG